MPRHATPGQAGHRSRPTHAQRSNCHAQRQRLPRRVFGTQVAPVIVILFLMFAGYFLREDSIPPWLAWIKYASFIRYAFQAIDRPLRRPGHTGQSSDAAAGSRGWFP